MYPLPGCVCTHVTVTVVSCDVMLHDVISSEELVSTAIIIHMTKS